MQSIIANPADGARLRVVGDVMRVLATAEQTGGAYEIFEMEAPEGSGPPPHAHPWSEAYLVLEGEAEVYIDGVHSIAGPGCFFQIPPRVTHTHRVRSKSARFFVVTSPAGALRFMAEVDAETAGSCEDMDKVIGIAVKHGFSVPSPASA